MIEKDRKTLYLPLFITEILDKEGEKYDGPGVVASAAILAFGQLTPAAKAKAYENYRQIEIQTAIAESYQDSQKESAKTKQKHA